MMQLVIKERAGYRLVTTFGHLNVDERKLHNYKLPIDSKFSIRGNEPKEKIFWLPVISAVVAAAVTFLGCTGKLFQ